MKNLEWKAKVDLIVVMLFCSRNVCTADGKGSFFFSIPFKSHTVSERLKFYSNGNGRRAFLLNCA